ncbi:caspase, EACC1-associated type [Phytohabitans houttuyneae]|uniref:Uncharacterized protein n=1 Tax=Phytohabitans houttuyneae TaxID=1076126 RepID=A0A6V8KC54_9ACTN|nr:AAA family ATPase [Phytohabitans houttuyneae]GFJ81020.1 hypothetical protein Phou_052000 [Phytohabitans houttuyneae]
MSNRSRRALATDGLALLIGAGTYTGALTDVPAVASTLADLERLLISRCGMRPSAVRRHLDLASPLEMGDVIAAGAEDAAGGPLLVYYVGHGLVSSGNGLYLATAATDRRPSRVEHTALSYQTVRRYLWDCAARPLIVVLDCCFAGKATAGLGGTGDEMADLAGIDGAFVLTSAGADELALAPEGARHTAFTGELIRLLTDGWQDGPQYLTLQDLYRELARTLPAAGGPRPRIRTTGNAGHLILTDNPAYRIRAPLRGPAVAADPLATGECPYRGLAAFESDDAQWFYGREALTESLVRRVAERFDQPAPLFVTGASGAGKSSLLRAGLLPAVARGDLDISGSVAWPRLLFTPTADPIGQLAQQLAGIAQSGPDRDRLRATLLDRPSEATAVAHAALRETLGPSGDSGRVVLVVDQFEETFTQCTDPMAQQAFIAALGALAGDGDDVPAALVVLGVRADFLGRCAGYPGLARALENSPALVGAMNGRELTDAVERPAAAVGLAVETGLADLMLADLGVPRDGGPNDHAGRLPLLSHALLATWHNREDGVLTIPAYRATGGIHGALASTADKVLADLDEAERAAARQVLCRLVRVGDGTDDTRRRVGWTQLLSELADPASAETALRAFSADQARLVTIDEETVEITHEALLSAWPTLRAWLDSDREGLIIHQRLLDAALAWDREGREPAALYGDSRLEVARGWAESQGQPDRLGELPAAFLAESIAAETARQSAAKRRTRRLAVLSLVLTILLVASVTAAVAAVTAFRSADEQRRIAAIRALTVQADAVQATQPGTATQLAVAAYRLDPSRDNRANLIKHIQASRYAGTVGEFGSHVRSLAVSPKLDLAVLGGFDNLFAEDLPKSTVWDIRDRHRPRRVAELPHEEGWNTGPTYEAAFSPDGRYLIEGNVMWDLKDPANPQALSVLTTPGLREAGWPRVWAVAYSPDGDKVVISWGNDPRQVAIWDVTDPANPRIETELPQQPAPVWSVAFSPDGETLLTGSDNGQALLWDIRYPGYTPSLRSRIGSGSEPIWTVGFSRSRDLAVVGTGSGRAELWNVSDPIYPTFYATLTGMQGAVWTSSFNTEGTTVTLAGRDDTGASVWDITSAYPRRVATLEGHSGPVSEILVGDDRTMLTAALDGSARIWSTVDPLRPDPHRVLSPLSRLTLGDDGGTVLVHGDAVPGRLVTMPERPAGSPSESSFQTGSGETVQQLTAGGRTALISAGDDFLLRDLSSGAELARFPNARAVQLAEAAPLAAVIGGETSGAVLWDLGDPADPEQLATLPDADTVALSRDGRVAMAWSEAQQRTTVWNLDDRHHPRQIFTADGTARTLSPDGTVAMITDPPPLPTATRRANPRPSPSGGSTAPAPPGANAS